MRPMKPMPAMPMRITIRSPYRMACLVAHPMHGGSIVVPLRRRSSARFRPCLVGADKVDAELVPREARVFQDGAVVRDEARPRLLVRPRRRLAAIQLEGVLPRLPLRPA